MFSPIAKLAEFHELGKQLLEYFDCPISYIDYYPISDGTKYYWSLEGNNLHYDEEPKIDIEQFNYLETPKGIWEKEDYTLFLTKSDFGEGSYLELFDNSKRMKNNA